MTVPEDYRIEPVVFVGPVRLMQNRVTLVEQASPTGPDRVNGKHPTADSKL